MSTRPTELPAPGSPDVLYLIDLSGYVFRAYHAISPLTSPGGEPTHATYGTVTMLSKLIAQRKPAYLGIAMDPPGKTFRDAIDARYKAHRPPPPPDLMVQMSRCKEIVEAYRIPVFLAENLEADDLIAVAVERAKEKGLRVVIASSDKDLMQLVDDSRVMLWDAMRNKVYGTPEVVEKFGVPPAQVRDLLALVGDTSDNVPGVPGVGPKTAAELLQQFGTLEAIYASLNQVKRQRVRELLQQHEADARISQRLVTLHTEAPVVLDLEALRYGGADSARLRELFTELGFTQLLKLIPAPEATISAGSYRSITIRADLEKFAAEAKNAGKLGLEIQTTSRDAMTAHVCGVSLAFQPGQAVYVPLGHRYLGAPSQISMATFLEVIGPLLSDPAVAKVGHDVKFNEVVLMRHGVKLAGVTFDSMLASYLLNPEDPHELAAVADRAASIKMPSYDTIAPKRRGQAQRTLDDLEVEQATGFAAPYAEIPLILEGRLSPLLRADKLDKLLTDLELPLSTLLAQMEHTGVLIDPAALGGLATQMQVELTALEQKALEAAGHELNLGSPKQIETILFDVLKLKVTKKTKTGRSTDAEALEALVDDHPLPGLILEHRAIAKLKGTYVDALPKLVHPQTGRIHTRWSQAVAATGRISSQDPNLQNIPIRTPLGKLIRRAFIAPPGTAILSADYSQIELRILAHLSKDPVLVDAFRTGQDVHVRTAMEIFGVDAAGVTDEMRRRSKTINFGVIYGMGEAALTKRLGITRAEAAKFIDAYFARYHGVAEFMERTMNEARKTESVHTLLGRKRLLPDLRSTDRMRRAYAERIAQNTPILGAVEEATAKVREAMETVFPLDVPLLVEVGSGPTWADAH
ncbi:MAG: DNA polymerase I [Polyangiaceae bacterium]|nr:DNA polymerase I [Polyangiaceae bacterium]